MTGTKNARTFDLRPDGRIVWRRMDDTAAQRRATLKFRTAGQLLNEAIPERRSLLNPWFREQESALLYAPTGAGKSLFALSAAIAVAGGGQFLGWTVDDAPEGHEGWRVAYVDGEMHIGDIQERLRGLLAGADKVTGDRVLKNLGVFSRQGQEGHGWFPSITDPEGVAFYRDLIREWHVDLVVFDNFSTLGEVEDENSASSFNAITQTLLALKQLGVATLLVHHAGKNGDFRGSSKLAATFEIILKLDPVDPSTVQAVEDSPGSPVRGVRPGRGHDYKTAREARSPFRAATFRTEFEKVRRGVRPPTVFATLENEPVFEGGTRMRWHYATADNPRLSIIREGLEEGRWTSQKAIAGELGVDAGTITRDIQMGSKLGLWTRAWVTKKLHEAVEIGLDEDDGDGTLNDF